jgi:hypothetical protein
VQCHGGPWTAERLRSLILTDKHNNDGDDDKGDIDNDDRAISQKA